MSSLQKGPVRPGGQAQVERFDFGSVSHIPPLRHWAGEDRELEQERDLCWQNWPWKPLLQEQVCWLKNLKFIGIIPFLLFWITYPNLSIVHSPWTQFKSHDGIDIWIFAQEVSFKVMPFLHLQIKPPTVFSHTPSPPHVVETRHSLMSFLQFFPSNPFGHFLITLIWHRRPVNPKKWANRLRVVFIGGN